jgi:hypothetical protein
MTVNNNYLPGYASFVTLFVVVAAGLLLITGSVAAGVLTPVSAGDESSGTDTYAQEQLNIAQTDNQSISVEQTTIDTEMLGVVQHTEQITVRATGVTSGGETVDGQSVTFSIGNEVATTATVTDGTAVATFDPTTLDIAAGQLVSVGIVEAVVESSASVEVVHEVQQLNSGFNLLSVPQPAEITTENVSAINVWDSGQQTYTTVIDSEIRSPEQLHNALYVAATNNNARFGLTFGNQPPAPGTAQIDPGWNFIGSNFAIDSIESGESRSLDTDLIGIDPSGVTVFDKTLTTQLAPDAEIGPYQAYWVFAESETLTRPIVSPPYDPDDRAEVLGTGGPDTLTVTSDVSSVVRPGQNITVSASIENVGLTARSDVPVSFSVDGTVLETDRISVDSGATEVVNFTVNVSSLNITPGTTVEQTVAVPGDKATATVTVRDQVDSVVLDSVSSLLNASGQPLTNDSVIAVSAEPTATNMDADGDGDAVSYPSETDIPVVAVDDTVVGITGPFATTDTDFANFGNEELLLNIYDNLLGGSGTILHDEGHGQFYTLSENGGDDYQAFAQYARDNGYHYEATSRYRN